MTTNEMDSNQSKDSFQMSLESAEVRFGYLRVEQRYTQPLDVQFKKPMRSALPYVFLTVAGFEAGVTPDRGCFVEFIEVKARQDGFSFRLTRPGFQPQFVFVEVNWIAFGA